MKKTKNVLDMARCIRGDKDRASEFGVMRQEVEGNSDLERSRYQMRKVRVSDTKTRVEIGMLLAAKNAWLNM